MFVNVLKLFLLTGLPVAFLIAGGYMVSEEVLLFTSILALVFLASVYLLSDKVVLKMCHAEALTPYHSPTLFTLVREQSEKAGVRMPQIYAISGAAPNAFATGRSPRKGAIVFTDGILKEVSHEELRSIISHELSHIKRGDTLVANLTAIVAGMLGVGIAKHYATVDQEPDQSGSLKRGVMRGYAYFLAPIPAMVVTMLVSKGREFVADAAAARITGQPLQMASAIRVMEKRKHQNPLIVSPAVAHLFTVSPLTVGRIARLFYSHPPMEKRIERLEHLGKIQSAA